ncbi:MAG: hypothetical protein Q8O99_03955 [bacterium]|nr:hypothetical protein [bacterium]
MNGLYSMMRRERDIIQEAGEFFDQAGNRMEGPYVALFTDFMTGDGQIISDIDDFRERMEEI